MGKRCIHYASQDGPIHIQSGTGFMTLQALHGSPGSLHGDAMTWRLEMSVSAYGELFVVAANPVCSETRTTKRPSCEEGQ